MKLSIFDIMPGVVFDVEEEKLVMGVSEWTTMMV